MAKYDIYISYARRDGSDIARAIAGLLKEKGISVFFDVESLRVGSNFVDQIAEAISACEYFIPVITDSYNHSSYAMNELIYALSLSRDRSKKIIPVIETDTMSSELKLMLCSYQYFSASNLEALIETICAILSKNSAVEKLYEKLGLSDDNRTSSDLMFTVDIVSCLGACGLAPVMVVDEVVHGQATPELAAELIDKIRAEESAA